MLLSLHYFVRLCFCCWFILRRNHTWIYTLPCSEPWGSRASFSAISRFPSPGSNGQTNRRVLIKLGQSILIVISTLEKTNSIPYKRLHIFINWIQFIYKNSSLHEVSDLLIHVQWRTWINVNGRVLHRGGGGSGSSEGSLGFRSVRTLRNKFTLRRLT